MHDAAAGAGNDVARRGRTQHLTQGRVDQPLDPVAGRAVVAQGAVVLQRIIDPVADEGVDHEALLVGGELDEVAGDELVALVPEVARDAVDRHHLDPAAAALGGEMFVELAEFLRCDFIVLHYLGLDKVMPNICHNQTDS